MKALHYKIYRIEEMRRDMLTEMFHVFSKCYDCVTFDDFMSDIKSKTHIIVLYDSLGIIRGFSTQQIYSIMYENKTLWILFSGDTIIDPSHWGSQELVRGWCEVVAAMMEQASGAPCYWFLISKGYRTYLYLPTFFKSFHPSLLHHDEELKKLLDFISSEKFPDSYDDKTGLIDFAESRGQLKAGLQDTSATRMEDAFVNYFHEKNPQWKAGVELACIALLDMNNLKNIGRRMMERHFQK